MLRPKFLCLKKYSDFRKTVKIGKALTELHIDYEKAEPHKALKITKNNKVKKDLYKVTKMKLSTDMEALTYNSHILIENIPKEIDEYKVNGSNILKLLISHYQKKEQDKSGYISDPNEYKNGKYIYNLVLSLITVSLKSVKLMRDLPKIQANFLTIAE